MRCSYLRKISVRDRHVQSVYCRHSRRIVPVWEASGCYRWRKTSTASSRCRYQGIVFHWNSDLGLRQSDDKVLRRLLTLMKKEVTGGCTHHIIKTLGGFSLHRIQWNVPGTEPQGTESPPRYRRFCAWSLDPWDRKRFPRRTGFRYAQVPFKTFYCVHVGEDWMGRRHSSHSEMRIPNKMLIDITLQKDTNCDIQVTNSRSCSWYLSVVLGGAGFISGLGVRLSCLTSSSVHYLLIFYISAFL